MKKKLLSLTIMLISIFSFAQVGIGTENPDLDSDLTLASVNKGLLLNKVTLSSTSDASPLSAHVKGMFVYNTTVSGDVTEGVYYNDGNNWIKVDSNSWNTLGNTDEEVISSTQALGASYSSGSVLGTLGTEDNLVVVSGGKVHSILSTDGTMNGGGEATSSFSWGTGNTVGTKNNTALGSGNTASGDYSASIGSNNNNTATNSISLGLNNTVSGNKNYVIGANNQVTSTNGMGNFAHTFVAGSRNTVSALNSIVLGYNNTLTSAGHIMGYSNTGQGTMIGSNNNNLGGAFLIGVQNSSAADIQRSFVIGSGGNVAASNTTVFSNGYHFFNTAGNITEVGINVTSADIIENIDLTVDRAIRIKPQTPYASDSNQINCTTSNEGTIRYNLSTRKHEGCGSSNGTTSTLAWRALY